MDLYRKKSRLGKEYGNLKNRLQISLCGKKINKKKASLWFIWTPWTSRLYTPPVCHVQILCHPICDDERRPNLSAALNRSLLCRSICGWFWCCSADQNTCTDPRKTILHLAQWASTVKRLSPAVVKLYDFPCCLCLQASDITADDESSFGSVLRINTAHLSSLKRGKVCWLCIQVEHAPKRVCACVRACVLQGCSISPWESIYGDKKTITLERIELWWKPPHFNLRR